MRLAVFTVVLCACACASANTQEEAGRQPTMVVSPDKGVVLGEAPTSTTITVAAPPTMVWLAVKKVYADWAIPMTVENPAAHQLGNPNFYKTRTFAGQPMTALVDCGIGATGPNAAKYRIYMSLLTNVSGDANGGTRLQTGFLVSGRDIAGNSTETVSCASTGRLEQLFRDRVKTLATTGGGIP